MVSQGTLDKIKHTAKNTDSLISKLDQLTGRIDAAKASGNEELVKYYEDQFSEVSVEFMDGVETILDSWYELRGVRRPDAEDEDLSDDTLEQIHSVVVNILQDLPFELPPQEETAARTMPERIADLARAIEVAQTRRHEATTAPMREKQNAPAHKVDFRG